MFEEIVKQFAINNPDNKDFIISPFGSGLINRTWKVQVKDAEDSYILQNINDAIFKNPGDIALNIRNISNYLQKHYPGYLFMSPIKTITGDEIYKDPASGYYRVFHFLQNSTSFDTAESPVLAREAAHQFALFTKLLSGFDVQLLKITLPHFHDLGLRYKQFLQALKDGNKERIKQSQELIAWLMAQHDIVDTYELIVNEMKIKTRVTHHDTKCSNVLFDKNNHGLCVIDLDTVMPGYYISDVGDIMRTYLSPASEEEKDFSKIDIRVDYFKAIAEGYLSEMKDELNEIEIQYFVYAGKFLIYMQAIRFLTDHLNNDIYYGAKYEGHNYIRAKNQAVLLQKYIEKEELLNSIVKEYSSIFNSATLNPT